VKNREIARCFETIADVMEIRGENAFRVNTYRNVAHIIADLGEDIETALESGRLAEIRGIGKSTLEKVEEYLQTGSMSACEKALEIVPPSALELLRIPGVGPRTVAQLMNEKGIDSIDKLEKALDKGALAGLKGFGEKTAENMRRGIQLVRAAAGRQLLSVAREAVDEILAALADDERIRRIEPAGSVRRWRETVHDIDILAAVDEPEADAAGLIRRFTRLPAVDEVLAAGKTKGSVRLEGGISADLRVVAPDAFGAALQYFTGSKEHNVRLRAIAHERGLKINEYGLFKGEKRLAGETEQGIYEALGLPWVPPELREDRGEIEAALEGKLPELVEPEQIRGELHAHTDWSDGDLPVLEMARKAREFGHRFVVISDHSKSTTVANGLDEDRLRRQLDEIDAAREKLSRFTILKGIEVDILPDGALDLADDVLEQLDWVIASVHSRFKMGEDEMTERVCRAARHPLVNVIGHPTGRLIGEREPYALDVTRLVETCAESGACLELNAHPVRLDLSDLHCRLAREAGVPVAIGADAHDPAHYAYVRYGVATARRGWLRPADVVNTWTLKKIRKLVASKRKGAT
jgi:DNA polymerase (family 10)